MNRKALLLFTSSLFFLHSVYAQLNLNWIERSDLNLPVGMRLFQTNTPINGNAFQAHYIELDLNSDQLELRSFYSNTLKSPAQFAQDRPEQVYAAINGGYFALGTTTSYSMIMSDGDLLASNIRALTRVYSGTNQAATYYPTRGAFGMDIIGNSSIEWIYNLSPGDTPFAYPQPSPNTLSELPKPQPSSSFPSGGSEWEVYQAMGGGPILVKSGNKITNYEPELFQSDITGSIAPRTAIGIRPDNKIIMVVADGRQPTLSNGISLPNLADLMIELGCTDALNLDGGGSSGMWADGQVIGSPSDGSMRRVPSALLIVEAPDIIDTEDSGYGETSADYQEYAGLSFKGTSSTRFVPLTDQPSEYDTASYAMPSIIPGKNELALWWQNDISNTSSSTVIIDRPFPLQDETLILNQTESSLASGQFHPIGVVDLSDKDTVRFINDGEPGKILQLDALRIKYISESVPEMKFADGRTGALRATGETITLQPSIQSFNSALQFSELSVFTETTSRSLQEKIVFENPVYADTYEYDFLVIPSAGRVSVIFQWKATSGELFELSFVVTIQNNPPTADFSDENKSLNISFGNSYQTTVSLSAGSLTRPLKRVEMIEKIGTEESILETRAISSETFSTQETFSYTFDKKESSVEIMFTVYDELEYNSSAIVDFTVNDLPLNTNEDLGSQILVFPNPANNYVTVEMNQAPFRLQILDLQGRLVLDQEFKKPNGTIAINSLAPGNYSIRILSPEMSIYKKLIINK